MDNLEAVMTNKEVWKDEEDVACSRCEEMALVVAVKDEHGIVAIPVRKVGEIREAVFMLAPKIDGRRETVQ